LDSIEYECTYLELRPARERLTVTTDAPILARRAATMQADGGAVASNGHLAAIAEIIIGPPGRRATPTVRPDLALQAVGRSAAEPDRLPGGPPGRTLRVAGGRRPDVASDRLISLRPPSRPLVASSLLVVVSAAIGVVADLEQRAGPFGADITRGLDRLVAVLGTCFAGALWARCAPHASATFSRTIVVLLCGVGLIGGVVAAARALHS
jgi:hypothetical protein